MKIKAIIFDVDDTLISTSGFAFINLNKAAERLGVKRLTREKFLEHWGYTTEKMVPSFWPGLSLKEFEEVYNKVGYGEPYPLIEGARETLDLMKKNDIVLGILTSRTSKTLPIRLKQVNLSLDYFKFVQYSDESDYHKPDPRVFEQILKKFNDIGIKNGEILYVGDHLYDAKASLSNNLNFLGVLTGTTEKKVFLKEGVDEKNLINSINDFKKWFLQNIESPK